MSSERVSNNNSGRWWGEHVFRYHIAKKYLKGDEKILDIASGNGYGAYILAEKLTQGMVTGGDIDEDSIQYCNKEYNSVPNLEFKKLDVFRLPYPDGTFDVITSFETLEHVVDGDGMIKELKRVLKKKGLLFLSTPNFPVISPTGKTLNPFHIHEYTVDELQGLLQKHFQILTFGGQNYIRYKNAGLFKQIGKFLEFLLFTRGVRKIPIKIQDLLMNPFAKGIYARPDEFEITEDKIETAKCITLFAICTKENDES